MGLFSRVIEGGGERAVHEATSRVSRYNRELLEPRRLGEIKIASNLLALDIFNRYLGTNTKNVYL